MNIINFKSFLNKELSDIYPKTEIDTFFFLLMEEYLGFQRVDTFLKADFKILSDTLSVLKTALKRLQNEEPIQYIFGKTEFYGLPFLVNKNTLIPRPETEELVEWMLNETAELQSCKVAKLQPNVISSPVEKSLHILDIGTGSGCIAISLAKNLENVRMYAIDISTEALKIAKKNSALNKVNVTFLKADILKIDSLNIIFNELSEMLKVQHHIKFDAIVSNPPYVRELEKVEIKNNVLENEPHLALFVDDENPLIFYKKIANLAKEHLTKNGLLFFEINQYLGKETFAMLQEKGFTAIELKKDIFGNDRMIKANLL